MSEISSGNKGDVNLTKINEISEEDEYNDDINKLNIELNNKLMENEKYQQEIHELKNNLKACIETQKDLLYTNELIEENLKAEKQGIEKRIFNLSEKFSLEKQKYEEKISELRNSLSREEKKNEELRETLSAKEKLFNTLRSEDPDKTHENLILKEKINCLIDDLEKKDKIERELLSKQQTLEENNSALQKNYNEISDILQTKNVDLQSLNEILETTRDELFVCRSELESLKAVPASNTMKGNSLFAEVEDNRKKLVNDMASLKNKYLHMKRTYDSKEMEIRALKAERAALLQKLEDETVLTVDHSAKLIDTYKSRISELESKLKIEEKKLKIKDKEREQLDVQNNFSYLQSLLTAKKKEVKELINKLEESSIQKILQEEMKYEIEKQLRQWRYKAMSYQAQLLAAQNQAKCDKCLKIELKDSGDNGEVQTNTTQQIDRQSSGNTAPNFQEVNRFESTLENLLEIPRVSLTESKETGELFRLESSIPMDETLPISSNVVSPIISISDDELNKENRASASNINETILKSALAKSEETFLCKEKTKKSLRFTKDTVDHEKRKLTRQKTEKKYPVVFIASKK